MGTGEGGVDCKYVIGLLSTGLAAVTGGLVYCAKGWLNAVLGQVKEKSDTIAQLNAAHTAAKKKGDSP